MSRKAFRKTTATHCAHFKFNGTEISMDFACSYTENVISHEILDMSFLPLAFFPPALHNMEDQQLVLVHITDYGNVLLYYAKYGVTIYLQRV